MHGGWAWDGVEELWMRGLSDQRLVHVYSYFSCPFETIVMVFRE